MTQIVPVLMELIIWQEETPVMTGGETQELNSRVPKTLRHRSGRDFLDKARTTGRASSMQGDGVKTPSQSLAGSLRRARPLWREQEEGGQGIRLPGERVSLGLEQERYAIHLKVGTREKDCRGQTEALGEPGKGLRQQSR